MQLAKTAAFCKTLNNRHTLLVSYLVLDWPQAQSLWLSLPLCAIYLFLPPAPFSSLFPLDCRSVPKIKTLSTGRWPSKKKFRLKSISFRTFQKAYATHQHHSHWVNEINPYTWLTKYISSRGRMSRMGYEAPKKSILLLHKNAVKWPIVHGHQLVFI